VNKKFYFFNKKLKENEYFDKIIGLNLGNYSEFYNNYALFKKHSLKFPLR
jgi:hypothetical protein